MESDPFADAALDAGIVLHHHYIVWLVGYSYKMQGTIYICK